MSTLLAAAPAAALRCRQASRVRSRCSAAALVVRGPSGRRSSVQLRAAPALSALAAPRSVARRARRSSARAQAAAAEGEAAGELHESRLFTPPALTLVLLPPRLLQPLLHPIPGPAVRALVRGQHLLQHLEQAGAEGLCLPYHRHLRPVRHRPLHRLRHVAAAHQGGAQGTNARQGAARRRVAGRASESPLGRYSCVSLLSCVVGPRRWTRTCFWASCRWLRCTRWATC